MLSSWLLQEVLYSLTSSNPQRDGCLRHPALRIGTTLLATSLSARPSATVAVAENEWDKWGQRWGPVVYFRTTEPLHYVYEHGDSHSNAGAPQEHEMAVTTLVSAVFSALLLNCKWVMLNSCRPGKFLKVCRVEETIFWWVDLTGSICFQFFSDPTTFFHPRESLFQPKLCLGQRHDNHFNKYSRGWKSKQIWVFYIMTTKNTENHSFWPKCAWNKPRIFTRSLSGCFINPQLVLTRSGALSNKNIL